MAKNNKTIITKEGFAIIDADGEIRSIDSGELNILNSRDKTKELLKNEIASVDNEKYKIVKCTIIFKI